MFYREGEGFAVEEARTSGPNVLSFDVVSGRRRWYIIGCYLAPDDAQTIERVVTALGDQPRGTALRVVGDLNTDLGDMACDERGTETDGTGNGRGAVVGKAGESGEGEGAGKKKHRWWVPLRRNRGSTEEEVPIKFGTYNIRNGMNGGL